MAQVYRSFMTEVCALPVILGEKSTAERFAGAVQTYCLEAMMQDGKAVQAGTSHYLGTNFATGADIQFVDTNNREKYAHTTSWGVSTRLIGTLIMTHSDDDGLRLPPRLAPYHVVIIPSGRPGTQRDAYIDRIEKLFQEAKFADRAVSVEIDQRDTQAGTKKYEWIKKGIPIRLEIGAREASAETVTVYRRDQNRDQSTVVKMNELVPFVIQTLGMIQAHYYQQAHDFLNTHMRTDLTTLQELQEYFSNPENIGFVQAKWCGDAKPEELLKQDFKVTIRCIPEKQTRTQGTCILTGKPATMDVIFGKSY